MSAVSTYAGALFEAAEERGELEEVLSDLGEFVAALHESEELRLFFYGGQIPERQKRRALDGLTEGMKISTTDMVKERLGSVLEGREVILETNVDPELIGGAVFRFGGRMMDGSIRGRLESLREGMLERSVV